MKKYLYMGAISLFWAFLFSGTDVAAARLQQTEEKIVIVIDPGHGGENEGSLEARIHMENPRPEKEMALATAMAMYEELSLYDNVEVYLTRTEDRDLSLKERAQFAADVQADFLFSIHYNASVNHDLFGTEVWVSVKPPYNAYGYQFGAMQMEAMQEAGLFLRGVKARFSENPNTPDKDYYGILRESADLGVPAVIIEHCHVDEKRDVPFCDSPQDWAAMGRADALAVARYFGLKSAGLSVDYSADSIRLPQADEHIMVPATRKDVTPPDVCRLELLEADYETGKVAITVTATDYDSPLLYYDYSTDGGNTYSSLEPWPESNALQGTYADTFTLRLQIPSGTLPTISLRAYNLYDVPKESNLLEGLQSFRYGEETVPTAEAGGEKPPDSPSSDTETKAPSSVEAMGPGVLSSQVANPKERGTDFLTFLKICLLFVALLIFLVLTIQLLIYRRRRKRRRAGSRQQRKLSGQKQNHKK